MTDRKTGKKKHYGAGNHLASIMIIVLIFVAVLMGVGVYRGMNELKHWIGTDAYDVILKQSPSNAFSLYYDDYGPYRTEEDGEKELFSYARYLHASLLYHAYEDAGDSEQAARMQKVIDANEPFISATTFEKMHSYGDFR